MAFFVLVLAVGFNVAALFTGNSTFLWICLALWPVGIVLAVIEWVARRKSLRTAVGAAPAGVRELGLHARRTGEPKAAERLLRAAIDQGDVEAIWEMAVLVMERDGVAAGEPWARMAARNGHSFAQAFLDHRG